MNSYEHELEKPEMEYHSEQGDQTDNWDKSWVEHSNHE